MKKTILTIGLAILGSISVTYASCHGQTIYSDSPETTASIKSDADLNCCQGDTIWIVDIDTGDFFPWEVALNGPNSACIAD